MIANHAPLFHAFVVGPSVEAPSLLSVVDEAQMVAIASAVRLVICGVYDGEVFLLCSFDG